MKVQVNLNDDLVKKLDEVSDIIGASRSSLCAMFIYHGLRNYLNVRDDNSDWLSSAIDKAIRGWYYLFVKQIFCE